MSWPASAHPLRATQRVLHPERRPLIEVAVAIVRDAQGRILMAERLPHQLSPGYWELPGGKIDPGETPLEAARRETLEETGLAIGDLRPFVRYEHLYPLRRLRLNFFLAGAYSGQAHGREGQRIAWVNPVAPEVAPILPSNYRALALLGLPRFGRSVASDRWQPEPAEELAIVRPGKLSSEMALRRIQHFASRGLRPRRLWVEGPLALAIAARAEALVSHEPPERWPARPSVPLWVVRVQSAEALHRYAALGADVGLLPMSAFSEPLAASARALMPAVYLEARATELETAQALVRRHGLSGHILRECGCGGCRGPS
ncbi:MAG: (deoxy)nucleoside triphosphate pyrophosphohydrolase [Casimicrobiaceae bacterium]|nr:(deoxy)nucleoside triphosphate pyrophosphohydrolase [Casimicrobiaceae bacterium]MCX8097941.1 (deoxy)nucleoside triphosphate pyrophosphohydrolase [Casimicrobiaceae bacterium]MDW8312882.1 (deoxy)nucleoside triphosphate pyrophosphohydrolase [Burkholderiales bacterium]